MTCAGGQSNRNIAAWLCHCQNICACCVFADDSSSPMIGDVTTAYMRDRCLMPLGEYCTALRHQITSAADSCHPGSGVAADMQLAMLLALDRVKESTQWTLDYLQG